MAKGNKGNRGQSQPTTQPVLVERPASIDNGEDARSGLTERANQTATQPEPDAATAATSEAMAENIVNLRPNARNAFDVIRKNNAETLAAKQKLMSEARQRLAEAADLLAKGDETAEEANSIIGTVGVRLYQGRINGQLSADELTSIIGSNFGFKMKGAGNGGKRVPEGHPEASKTPFGAGERLRKRVVRAVQAHEYVTGQEASKFFDGLETEAVEATLNKLNEEGASLFTVYDNLTDLRSANRQKPVNSAFDPKAVAKLIGALSEEGAIDAIEASDELTAAYAELRDVLTIVGQELYKRSQAAA